jgi:hypothetical protein
MANNISKSQAEGLQAKVNAKGGAKGNRSQTINPKPMGKDKPIKKDSSKGLKIVLAKNRPIGLRYIEKQLALAGFVVVTEYEFAKPRKYRADISVNVFSPKGLQHILIEYEGLVSSKSRHTTLTGYTKDCDKYNIATSLGYKVYRYTALNYKNIHELIKSLV